MVVREFLQDKMST